MSRRGCLAERIGDQQVCGFCALQWDHDDPDPPQCDKAGAVLRAAVCARIERDYDSADLEEERPYRPKGWQLLLVRTPFVPPRDYHGPRQPGAVAAHLVVDGHRLGQMWAPLPDTARGRGELWDRVRLVNIRR